VLTGAGLSTESGIPDYRGPTGVLRRQTPMTLQAFTGDALGRRRYWARSLLGWRTIGQARPNAGHVAVAELERLGVLAGTVTQNVDGLHGAAGSRDVIELHGNLARVVCLDCRALVPRREHQARLHAANPEWDALVRQVNPDGDVDIDDAALEGFTVVACEECGGVLKPDVVFFGETVPPERVEASYALVASASLLLVLGSSLTVMSGRRFVLRAAKDGIPVAIVNDGVTRGDEYAAMKLDGRLGELLPALVEALSGDRSVVPYGRSR
jgi:NAD-dependent SIR2 family protein deacetylase